MKKKTIREWLNELPDGYRELALKYKSESWKDEVSDMECAILGFYPWDKTNEGVEFWQDVCNHYVENSEEPFAQLPLLPNTTSPIASITDERGSNYGHPYDHFQCTQDMYNKWMVKRDEGQPIDVALEKCLHHIVYLICDKLARMAENPLHQDNFDDIQGYGSLWKECVERHNETT